MSKAGKPMCSFQDARHAGQHSAAPGHNLSSSCCCLSCWQLLLQSNWHSRPGLHWSTPMLAPRDC